LKNISRRGIISVGIVATATVVLGQNSGVRVGIYRLSILVSAEVSQSIQKIIDIDWLTSADTINHIFGIGYTMSADTNSVSGIRGVTPPTQNPNRGEIWFCGVRLPNFPALYAVASLDADAASLGASVASLDNALSLSPSPTPFLGDPAFGLDAAGGVPIVVPDPITILDPVASSPTSSLTPSLRVACTRCVILLPSRLRSQGSK
jgi:hypothetical protein